MDELQTGLIPSFPESDRSRLLPRSIDMSIQCVVNLELSGHVAYFGSLVTPCNLGASDDRLRWPRRGSVRTDQRRPNCPEG